MTTIALRKGVEKALIDEKIDFDTWANYVNDAVKEKLEKEEK